MKNRKSKKIVGEKYWILNGHDIPVQLTLTDIVNDGRTAIFENVPSLARKIEHVYDTKEEAFKIKKY